MEQLSASREFEPPKYITSLIATINDGAKTAQTGALAFSAIGLYLMAAALATTDEDLLLQHTASVAQLGVQIPAVFSLAVAPAVFVAMHTFTLVRYDMLAVNVQQFRADLDLMVNINADRERCRQLLANVEFIVASAVPLDSSLHSRLFQWIVFGVIAFFPITVLLIVQVSTLRYQSDSISIAQRGALLIDLALLIWFFGRRRWVLTQIKRKRARVLKLAVSVLLLVLSLVLNFAWINVPRDQKSTLEDDGQAVESLLSESFLSDVWSAMFWKIVSQSFDNALCASGWGCRFLRVDHRTLVGRVWKQETVGTLQRSGGDPKALLVDIEGIVLRHRNLRSANLSESLLYNADFMHTDLSYAFLSGANLAGARFQLTKLVGADLTSANLSRAYIGESDLRDADLHGANLTNALIGGDNIADRLDLHDANLHEVHLTNSLFQEVSLRNANMSGAFVSHSKLRNVDMTGTDLTGAELDRVDLTNVSGLNQSQLDSACGEGVELPPGMTIKPCSGFSRPTGQVAILPMHPISLWPLQHHSNRPLIRRRLRRQTRDIGRY